MTTLIAGIDLIILQQSSGQMAEAIAIALDVVTDPTNLLFIFLATMLGLTMGMLPGMGGPVALALLIPLTFPLDKNAAIMILAANLGGTAFGGSITAILFNTPGDAPNAATLLDGYPMARQGKAGQALTASAVSSASGAVFGVLFFLITIPFIKEFALAFHSVDIFWLAVLGLVTVAVVATGSLLNHLIAGGLGLIIAFHGLNPITGTARFAWDTTYLVSGFPLVPLIIGLFAIAEMINLASKKGTISEKAEVVGGLKDGFNSVVKNRYLLARSSLIGWVIGVIPGAGGTVANFVSYLQAQQTSPNPESFGKGNVQGVIASEASNDAKDGGTMVPTLGLGIPGSASTAVLLGALVINGVTPGPLLFQENLQIVFIIMFALIISNMMSSVVGLLSVKHLAKLTRISVTTLVPIITIISLLGSFVIRSQLPDVVMAIGFGILGFFMLKFNMSRIAIILAIVLGPLAEENFHRALQISGGSYGVFFQRTVSLVLIALILMVIAIQFRNPLETAD